MKLLSPCKVLRTALANGKFYVCVCVLIKLIAKKSESRVLSATPLSHFFYFENLIGFIK